MTAIFNNELTTLISILNWNGTKDTINLLDGIYKHFTKDICCAVFDNGSDKDPTDLLLKKYPTIEVFRSPVNIGFTGGHNKLLEIASSRNYHSVLILNNDCEITIESIIALKKILVENKNVAIASPLIYRKGESNRRMMVGGHIDWLQKESIWHSTCDEVAPVEFPKLVVGTALLLRCEAMRKIGFLDDQYFAYFDDNDLSARTHKSGYEIMFCIDSICFHQYKSLSEHSEMALYLLNRNQWLFWRTHTPHQFSSGIFRNMTATTLNHISALKTNSNEIGKFNAIVSGWWDGFKGNSGTPPTKFNPPWFLYFFGRLAPYFFSKFLKNPRNAIKEKMRNLTHRYF